MGLKVVVNPFAEEGLQYITDPSTIVDSNAIHKNVNNQIVNGTIITANSGTYRKIDFSALTDGQTITVSGAAIGDTVEVSADDAVYGAALTASVGYTLLAWVSAANTVKVWSRISSFISVPAGSKYYVRILK